MGCAASEQLPAEMFATRQDRTQPGVGKRVGIAPTRLVFFKIVGPPQSRFASA